MADQRGEAGLSALHFAVRSVHAAQGNVSTGKTWFHAVLYVFRVEEHQRGAHRIFHGVDADTGSRILPCERVAQHSGYFERISAERRPASICGAVYSGGNARRKLRHLWTGV